MIYLDVDSISDLLPLAYSHTGIPAINQMEILRSFVHILHLNCIWCKSLTDIPVRAILIGCQPGEAPLASNHYDFISRLFNGFKYHSVYPSKLYGKPKNSKPNNKWENNPPGITEKAFDSYLNSNYDNNRAELLLQQKGLIIAHAAKAIKPPNTVKAYIYNPKMILVFWRNPI